MEHHTQDLLAFGQGTPGHCNPVPILEFTSAIGGEVMHLRNLGNDLKAPNSLLPDSSRNASLLSKVLSLLPEAVGSNEMSAGQLSHFPIVLLPVNFWDMCSFLTLKYSLRKM